jgi:hypothetical protein
MPGIIRALKFFQTKFMKGLSKLEHMPVTMKKAGIKNGTYKSLET